LKPGGKNDCRGKKPFEEIKEMIRSFRKVFKCGLWRLYIHLYGGWPREVGILNEELQMASKQEGIPLQVDGFTIERQCNADFFTDWMTG